MKHYINYLLIIGSAILLMAGCSSITGDSSSELDEMVIGEGTMAESSTAKSNYKDENDNGYPDEGEIVTGTYKALYAYDANDDDYQDLGDGRVSGTVNSVSELEQETLTTCDYKVQYRGAFEDDPFLDSGWVKNAIKCKGYDDNGNYNFTIVHNTDPRYTGEKLPAFGGGWEYHVYAVGGLGNVVRPETPVGN